jgi:hypothetical protein
VAELRLHFDVDGQRWEGVTGAMSDWATLTEVNKLLTLARSSDGQPAGFIFDHDAQSSEFETSLAEIDKLFGSAVQVVARQCPTHDTDEVVMLSDTAGEVAVRTDTSPDVVPKSGLLHARVDDVQIDDDEVNKVLTVTLSLPWWARFLRPWVSVRRRGRPEILALAPLRFRGRQASARMRYGLPGGTSTLVADVVKGTQQPWLLIIASSAVTALLLALALTVTSRGATDDSVVAPATTLVPTTDATIAAVTTTAVPETTAASTTGPETTTSAIAVATTQAPSTTAPRRTTTTSSTILPPGDVAFEMPTQFITSNDKRADLAVSSRTVRRGESIAVSVRVAGLDINPFTTNSAATLDELVSACRALIGVGTVVPPTPGWTPNITVSLVGTNATAGGATQLVVVGNINRECGDTLVGTSPPTIRVVRTTFYQPVGLQLSIPASLAAGTYDLVLSPFDMNRFTQTTPIKITVTN